jgi:hypothetical protein
MIETDGAPHILYQRTKWRQYTPQEIASLVPMPALLRHLGFEVNEQSRRTRCLIHGGANRTAFSWDEERWYCFRCNAGGDKYDLIRTLYGCTFKDALMVLCELAGLRSIDSVEWRAPTARERRQRERLEEAAEKYRALEAATCLNLAEQLSGLERMRDFAAERLHNLERGAPARFAHEYEAAWQALAIAAQEIPPVLAAYYVIAFGSEDDQQRFVLFSRERTRLTEQALRYGGFTDDAGHFVEVPL